ncbi:MAG: hypothetical protein SH856_14435 [Flavobacteriales bacterium]|nr:hypothetical protein [Flavobacteriales bacterium]
MKVLFDKNFLRKLKKERNPFVLSEIKSLILEAERAKVLSQVRNIRKMAGHKSFYRIRFGQYRIGLSFDGDSVTIITYSHRKDIYEYFPC